MSDTEIQLPTIVDLILWATEKPANQPIGEIGVECRCPIANCMTEQHPERKWYVGGDRCVGALKPETLAKEVTLRLPPALRDVVRLVDSYPFATGVDTFHGQITASAFLHILQEVRRVYEEKERRGEQR